MAGCPFINTRRKRVRTPLRLQMAASECGAVALSIVLAYYGLHVPLETLRIECGVSRDGSKASHLIQVARRYGLIAKGYTREPEQLAQMRIPLIVFWQFKHFVVVEGFGKDKVYLNDPANGRYSVTAQTFALNFTGIVLELFPGPQFVTSDTRRGLLTVLSQRLRGTGRQVLFLLLTGVALAVPNLLMPLLTQLFIDQYWLAGAVTWLKPLLLGLAITALLRSLLTWLQTQVVNRFYTQLSLAWSGRFLWHLLRLPALFYSQRSAGEICQRLAINQRLAALLAGNAAASLLALMMAVFYALFLFFLDAQLALLTLGVAGVNGLILSIITRRRSEMSQQVLMAQGQLNGAAMNGLRAIESLKAAGNEGDFFTRWAGLHAKLLNSQQQFAIASLWLSALPATLHVLNTIAILTLGSLNIIAGTLTLGALVAFQSVAMSFMLAISQLLEVGSKIQVIAGDLQRLEDVMNQAPVVSEQDSAPAAHPPLAGHLALHQISFGFCPLDPPLLKQISFTLQPRQQVALVGASGSGKSTLAKLIAGLYTPEAGEMLFDGKPRPLFMHRDLAFVDQEITVFAGTLRDNLSLWQDDIPEADLIQAARDACIHDLIMSRPGGYDALIQEGGGNFSGGELQRLDLARALATNPRLLILDEATRMLDPHNERLIYANLRRRGCTCLILSHRLATCQACDEILVLEAGKLVQRGTPAALQAVEGAYRRLIAEPVPVNRTASSARIGSPVEAASPTPLGEGNTLDELWASCQLLGKQAGIRFIRPHPSAQHPIAAIAATSQVRYRPVTLDGTWWRQDCGCLLAFDQRDHRPRVLLPARRGHFYTVQDVAQKQAQRLDASGAAHLKPQALLFYRPLPDAPLDLLSVMRFTARGRSRDLLAMVLIGVVTALLALWLPWVMGRLIENVIPTADRAQLFTLISGLVIAAVVTALLGLHQQYLALRLGTQMELAAQSAIWDRLLKLPASFFRHYTAGDLASRIHGIAAMRQTLVGATLSALFNSLFMLLTLWLMASYSVALAWLAIALALMAGLISGIGGMRVLRYERELEDRAGKLSGLLLQLISGINKLRSAGAEPRAFAVWATAFVRQQRTALRAATLRNTHNAVMSLFSWVGMTAIFAAVSLYGWGATLSTSQFLVFNAAFGLFSAAMLSLTTTTLGLLQLVPWYERAKPILHSTLETPRAHAAPTDLDGTIDIEQVTFAYHPQQPPVLHNLSLQIRAGEFVALVGASGSGKSTLLRLLLGFEQPTQGCIRYSGQALDSLDVSAVRRQLGVVLQHGQLLEGTVFSNIIGSRTLTLADAWQAARVSALADEIAALPMGMHTPLGDRATTLSGGQRQRLLIAQAIVHAPRIVLLDEATSALDNATQAQVIHGLRQGQATILMIAHRLSSLIQAERIIVLKDGKIAEQGSYQALLQQAGMFADMVRAQQN